MTSDGTVRQFDSGATRDGRMGKYEYARFFDPAVIKAFAAYMHRHRIQPDGSLRDPDNWKKGMPRQAYMDSLFRHTMDLWELHDYGVAVRPENGQAVDYEETLCAVIFNAMGYLHEHLKAQRRAAQKANPAMEPAESLP
jgi:hypothetical protein